MNESRDDVVRHPIECIALGRARETTQRAFEAHLTNDAHFVVDIEDAIVIEDVVGAVIARRRMISIH